MTERSASAPPRCAAVILAAGEARRMGQPKQLLLVEGKSLIVRTIESALAAPLWPVVVVLGAHATQIRPTLARYPLIIVDNTAWAEGMASSLRAGIEAVERFSAAVDAALFAVCDQPYFNAAVIDSLLAAYGATREIAAARYGGRCGVPAIFARRYFPELRALSGQQGARKLLDLYMEQTRAVDLPQLAFDLDTPAEYQDFLARAR